MTENERRQASLHISQELEKSGFSRHKLQTKASEVKILQHLANDGQNIHMFATRSNAEGVDITGSDRNTMVSFLDMCAVWSDNEINNSSNVDKQTLFVIEQGCVRDCYCKLRLLKESDNVNSLFRKLGGKQKLCQQDQRGEWYLSSEMFAQRATVYLSNVLTSPAEYTTRAFHVHGPCTVCDHDSHETDFEFCIPCNRMPDATLSRQKQLKDRGVLKEDMLEPGTDIGCHIVANGNSMSNAGHLEWRVSFALLERELIWSLDDMPCKCLVMLKMLVNQFVQPSSSSQEIRDLPGQATPYMVKTAILWLAEEGVLVAEEGMLIDNVVKCIDKLCSCIQTHSLPCYIRPETNLLAIKFDDNDLRERVVEILTDIKSWHWSRLLQCQALEFLQDVWEEFQPDVQNFFRHARHPNLKSVVCKDVVSFRSIQAMYMSVCDFSNSPVRHVEMLRSLFSLPRAVDRQLVAVMATIIANRVLFAAADVDKLETNVSEDLPAIEHVIEQEARAVEEACVPTFTADGEALTLAQQALSWLQMTTDTDNNNVRSAEEQWMASRFDVSSLGLQQAVKHYLRGHYATVYDKLQAVMASYKPQVLYIGMCGPEEVGEFDFIEYMCYITSSGKLPFAEKVSKCLSFDYVICRCDPTLPVFELERKLWREDEVPVCVHPRVLIHYLMFLVHFRLGHQDGAFSSLSYLLYNVQVTAPGSRLYGHVGWNLLGHGYFLMDKPRWASRAFRTSLKVKAKCNPAYFYLSNC